MARRKPKSIAPLKSQPPPTPTHIALLRGINVGGRNMLPMAELAGIFGELGCAGVQTYIQSGNVIFSAPPAVVSGLPAEVSAVIAARFGFEPSIVLRTTTELAKIAASHPFLSPGTDHKFLQVGFLSSAPAASRIAALDPTRSPGDRFTVRGREIYMHFPNGVLKSRLTGPYIDSTLGTSSTWRNWRTVLELARMSSVE